MRINGINASNSFPLFRGKLTLESALFNTTNGDGLSFSLQGEKIKVVQIQPGLFEVSLQHPEKGQRIYIVQKKSNKLQIKLYQKSSKTAVPFCEKKLSFPNTLNLTQQLQIIGKIVANSVNLPSVPLAAQAIYTNIVSQAKILPYIN